MSNHSKVGRRVVIGRGCISEEEIARVRDQLPFAEVLVVDREVLHGILREDDLVIADAADLVGVGADQRPIVSVGDLHVGPLYARYADRNLDTRHTNLMLLYELVRAHPHTVPRSALCERCWRTVVQPRTVDVAVHRLRLKLRSWELPFEIVSDGDGYRLLSTQPARKRIMIVEDEAPMQRAYEQFLRRFGVALDFAADLSTAVTKVETDSHDGYFIDLRMPGGCGSMLIPLIQSKNPRAPIMIVTGRVDDLAAELSAEFGVAHAQKPAMEPLVRFVERIILGQSAVATARGD